MGLNIEPEYIIALGVIVLLITGMILTFHVCKHKYKIVEISDIKVFTNGCWVYRKNVISQCEKCGKIKSTIART